MTTPMEPCLKLTKDEGKLLEDATLFRQLVGSLFYLTITRPDILYSVGVISQFMEKLRESHLIAAKRILRYVKSTLNFRLLYKQHASFSLTDFVDTDWAGNVNDRRSTTGYCFNIGSTTVSWYIKKQIIVAISSCEVEYVAATMATQELFHARTKHIKTHYHFVREKVLTKDIQLQKIRTEDQVADIFTKALGKAKFEVFRSALGVVDIKFALRGSVANQ
ncbi:secreted RxLR effector protein 161-like [Hibiscus syriacus]|uniref:secreted RxLR effector protein 161-like n=1 Tax=Hibiscus syriacus TaxID=106335 RepID=UPI0019211566|nr:secreted RxLR effector protein 161-like [Hibiscus syriacus]